MRIEISHITFENKFLAHLKFSPNMVIYHEYAQPTSAMYFIIF